MSRGSTRRRVLALATGGIASLLLAACRGPEPGTGPTATVGSPPASAQQTPERPAASASPPVTASQERKTLRVGVAISKSGPYAAAAMSIVYPNYVLWVRDVNEAGGLQLSDGIYTVELIEYDDQSNPEEAIRALRRLADQDKVDLLLAPYGTAINLAAAPTFHELGYPHLSVTNVSDKSLELVRRWPTYFTFGTSSHFAQAVIALLERLASDGQIGRRAALIYVDDEFGLELSRALRTGLVERGFDLLYDEGYPLGTGDFQPLVQVIRERGPDALLACTYPLDALALPQAAMLLDFNPPVYFSAVGPAMPLFRDQYGDNAEGVMGIGGIDPDAPGLAEYYQRHKAVTGQEPDRGASTLVYASLQVLQQALQRVGRVDRAALVREIATGSFETIIGTVRFQDNLFYPAWQIGQWQRVGDSLEFLAIWTPEAAAAAPLVPKPHWRRQA